MAVWFLSNAQREQLSGFPAEIGDEALDSFFTLSGADVTEARQRHGDGIDWVGRGCCASCGYWGFTLMT